MTVEVDSDLFTDWVYERINEFGDSYIHNDDFWNAVVDYFSEIGWDSFRLSDRNPRTIVDNIAINGEFYTLEEIKENNDLDSLEEAEEFANEQEWLKMADLYVVNWGI